MLVIVAPGQGAQTPGFLTPWLEDPTFAARFDWLATVAGLDLAHYGTQADAETIRDTRIAQPLLVATGLVAALVSAAIWAGITIATNTKIGLVAVGVGFLCGVAVRAAGKGDGVPFRVIGAACALLGIVLGNAFMIVNQASKEGIPLGIVEAIPYVFTFAGPIDYLFYAIGVWQGWKVAVAVADPA